MIAIQTAIGDIGGKATTQLSTSPASMINAKGFQYALDTNGVHILNRGDTDNNAEFTRTFTLATTDLGIKNPKRGRFFYVGYEVFQANDPMTISIKLDDQAWREYNVVNRKVGLQRVRVPIGRDGKGRYVTVKISSVKHFRLDNIDAEFYLLSSGNKGY